MPIITLTTDFGLSDSYVGAMKGVILGICPQAQIVDITHAITPQDIGQAAALLPTFVPFFPPDTVHLVVVDPGVGSARRRLALALPDMRLVAPDNGVLTMIWRDALAQYGPAAVTAVELQEPRFWRPGQSATFHGRDIFAPVAAHLAAGVAVADLGPAVASIVELPVQEPTLSDDGTLIGRVNRVDYFGNCISTITAGHLAQLGPMDALVVAAGSLRLRGVQAIYTDAAPGEALALVGSSGVLEVAVRNGNAAQMLGLKTGSEIQVWALPGFD